MGIDPTQTIVDLVTTTGELDPDKLGGYVVHHPSGMDVLAAPLRPEDAELVTEDRIGQLIDVAKAAYDIVVLDTPPHFDATTLAALDRSDRLVLVDDDGHPDRQELPSSHCRPSTSCSTRASASRSCVNRPLAARRPARERHLAHARHADPAVIPRDKEIGDRRQPRRPGHRVGIALARRQGDAGARGARCCPRRSGSSSKAANAEAKAAQKRGEPRAEAAVRRPPERPEGRHVQVLQVRRTRRRRELSLSDRIQSRNPDPVAPVTREQHAEPERAPAPTDPFADLKSRVHHDVITRLGPRLFAAGGDEGRDASIEPRVLEAVEEAIALDKTPLTRQERAQVTREIADDILGYGPLEPFLRDDTVSEIMVNGPHSIWVERRGKLLRTDAGFVDDQHLLRIIDKIISRIGRRIDEASPMVDARLPDGSRVNAIIPPLAVTGPTLTIRKFRRDPLTMEDLLRFGTLTPRAAQLLEACVRGKLNILISGGTGSGKTTTLNVLSAAIPEGERIVTVEDAAELQLRQEHVITLETRPANIEGKGMVSIRDLVRNCLRMRPDRIIVGECRGPETIDMLQAMNTGHDGSLTTIHANTPRDALSRVETLVLTGGVELPLKAIREQIASAFDMVVQVSRLVDGTRRITHITEVLRMESDVVTLQDLFIAKPARGRRGGRGGLGQPPARRR